MKNEEMTEAKPTEIIGIKPDFFTKLYAHQKLFKPDSNFFIFLAKGRGLDALTRKSNIRAESNNRYITKKNCRIKMILFRKNKSFKMKNLAKLKVK